MKSDDLYRLYGPGEIDKDFDHFLNNLDLLRASALKYISNERVSHVLGCEYEAVRLAEFYGIDKNDAAAAGILHDATKRLTAKEQLSLCDYYCLELDDMLRNSPKLLHAVTGAFFAKIKFGAPENICSSIRWHTTGKPGMSMLEKIIYIADYIEPTRLFPGVDELRDIAYKNINKAMCLGLMMSLEEVRSRGEEPYFTTMEAYEYYRNEG